MQREVTRSQQSYDDGYVSQDYQGYPVNPSSPLSNESKDNATLRAMLKEKDAEIRHLRGVMERNETAIFQVCFILPRK